MKTRQEIIAAGKLWQVYRDDAPDFILQEGSKTKCLDFVKCWFGMRAYKAGEIRLGQVIWEDATP